MNDINKVTIIGRMTRDVGSNDFSYTTGGTARLNISIACNESVKTGGQWQDKASFFDVTVWGKTAESLKPYLAKGKQIAVEGRLKQDRWTDKQSGQSRSKVYINAANVQLLGGNTQSNGNGGQQGGGYQQPPQDNGGNESDYPEEWNF